MSCNIVSNQQPYFSVSEETIRIMKEEHNTEINISIGMI